RHVRLAARGLLDRRRRARPGRGPRPPRAGASHPGQQRGRQLGRAARRVPRLGVGQGARLEREGRLPPDAHLPAAPRPRLACRRVPDRRRHPGGRGHHDAARVMTSTVEAAGRLPEPLGLAERAKRAFFRSFFRLLLGFIALAEWASAAWILFVAGVHVPRAAHLLAPLAIYALNRWIITRPRHARPVTGTLIRVYVPAAFSSIFLALFLALAGALWGVGALVGGPHLARAYYWLVNAGFATVAGLLFYGYTFGRRQLAVSHLEVPVRGLPSTLDGLRLVHLSDLHIGAHLDLAELGAHVER